MKEIGRNDPCHCGSGKKYKNCHMGKSESAITSNKTMMYLVVFAVIVSIAVFSIFYNWDKSPAPNTRTNTNQAPTPPPPGEAPPGKVWSSEHGHWHDI